MFQIRTESHFADSDVGFGQLRVPEFTPHEDPSKDMANFLRHTQLTLRRPGRSGRLFLWSPVRLPPRPRRRLTQPGTISTSKHSTTSPSCKSWKFANDRPHS